MPEAIRPILLAGAVVMRRNDLLVIHVGEPPARRRWSVPTAPVRPGESLVECAVRAVEGATGLPALSGEFLGWFESFPDGTASDENHHVVMCFEAVVLDPVHPIPGPGVAEARWMPVWEVSELPLADGLADLLSEHGVIDTLG